MKTQVVKQEPDKNFSLAWGRSFFICLGFASIYYIAYLAFLLHIMIKPVSSIF